MEPPIGRVDEEEEEEDFLGDDSDDGCEVGEVRKRVSRLAVEGGGADVSKVGGAYRIGGGGVGSKKQDEDVAGVRCRVFSGSSAVGGRTLPPPQAWLAVEDAKKSCASDPEEQWMRVLGGGTPQRPQRRSSFSVVRRERAAREAWLDRAWEMKKSWHERSGGTPDADTPVVVVVGKGPSSSPSSQAAGSAGGGVAMDMEEVRACRDLGLELPSDCTVEIQCYGLSSCSSPTHTASSGGDDSPSAGACSISSPGEDPMDVKARLKVWAQAVALASTTHLGS